MEKQLRWFLILVLVFFAGRWGVERFMEFADARYAEREEMARQVGERKAEQMRQTIEASSARRNEELRRQTGAAAALQSKAPPAAVSTQPLRRELDAATQQQSRRYDSVPPR